MYAHGATVCALTGSRESANVAVLSIDMPTMAVRGAKPACTTQAFESARVAEQRPAVAHITPLQRAPGNNLHGRAMDR